MVQMKQKVIWFPRLPGAIAGGWLMWHGQAYYRNPWLNANGGQAFASFELQGQGLMMFGLGMGIVAIVVACTTRLVPVDSGEEENGYNEVGMREGVWTYWHDNGQKQSEGTYKNDKQEGVWTRWHQNGKEQSEQTYKNGKPDGVWTWWDDKGNVEKTETCKSGKEWEGVFTRWDFDSCRFKTETYKNGELVK